SVSDHPQWGWQAAGGIAFAAAIFAAAFVTGERTGAASGAAFWLRIAVIASISGTLIGWAMAAVPLASFGSGGWVSSLAWACTALSLPILAAASLAAGSAVPAFAETIGRKTERYARCGRLEQAIGILLILLAVLGVAAALGLVSDPRYRDFPF